MGSTGDRQPADKPVGARAGARFPSAKQLEKFSDEDPVEPIRESRSSRPSGARFPSERQLERFDEPAPAAAPEPGPPQGPTREPAPPLPRFAEEAETEEAVGPRVRPYVLTKGRTQSTYELALETMVNLRADARWAGSALNSEYQPVRALCLQPVSVAEVAANLSIPLGVARVLLSDMAELGLLHIHGTERTAEGRPPMALMRRVLDGLQRL
ncbi:DUF742 domain-containing protein [Amycolatopsis acidiphila]|uniref:DUF742 domain-containing protein n=1 Tax=Amycolatopsis acidiphila TaxID=715473 RepID=A0A558AGR1_9PSEU|nr:DUF742 domain-containing protein [Amycolatopsis acidiphila]TVT23454.1 DUF742 domain-containing protein [Amycolatopsis acidiphila]UIJ59910.1 DUF742 domain-containing protein [Amycolatopsis acidiphila]GHG62491.1 hypothetical protein GCM10017788_18100 [Amycolatopsis acidiphila]